MTALATIVDKISLAEIATSAVSVAPATARRGDAADASGSDAANDSGTRTSISERGRELSAGDQRRISELKRIDAEVHAHEEAHINAGRGVVTSGPNYTYTYGPDGRQYAVAGEVGIDTAPEKKAQANIDKGQRIQDAALAPAQPSPQDYEVAAAGSQLEARGRSDLADDIREQEAAKAQAAENERQAQIEAAQQEANAASQAAQADPSTQETTQETPQETQGVQAADTAAAAAPAQAPADTNPVPATSPEVVAGSGDSGSPVAADSSNSGAAAAETASVSASADQTQAYVRTAQSDAVASVSVNVFA